MVLFQFWRLLLIFNFRKFKYPIPLRYPILTLTNLLLKTKNNLMKSIFPLMFLLIFFACKKQKNDKEYEEFNEIESEIPSTAYKYPEIELPKNFRSINLSINDTLTNESYEISCLQSNLLEYEAFNKAIRNALIDYVMPQGIFLDNTLNSHEDYHYSSLKLHPVEIFINNNIISVTYVEDSYSYGAAHHNHGWFSFNYDIKKKQPIGFENVFKIKTSSDSTDFLSYVAENQYRNCLDWYKPYESMDFSFSKKGIHINPALIWACGLNRSLLPYDNLKFLNPKWKGIFK